MFTFLQGGDSVFGRLLSDAGVDVDALREKISDFFSDAKQFGKNALDDLKQFWSEHGDSVLAVLQWLWQGCVDLTADIATLGGHLFDLLGGLITGFQTGDWTQFLQGCKELWQDFLDVLNGIGRAVFGELWDPLVDSMNSAWNLLKGFFSWFGDKIQWARNLWNGVKEFFNGADSDDEVDDNQSEKPKGSGGTTSGGAGRKAADGGVSNNVEKSSMGENSAGKSRATSSSAKSTSTEANRKATNASKRKAKKGIEVTYALNGHIQVDDYVKVDSKPYKGNYRASKIKFTGDTEGDDWKCVGLFVEVK